MGIIGAATGNGVGVESVAPGATLMPVRVLGDDGGGSIDDVARGVDWAREHGADVINLSLGSEVPLVGRGRRRQLRRRDPAGDRRRRRGRCRGGQQRRAGVRAARGGRRAAVRGRGRQAAVAVVLLVVRERAGAGGAGRVGRHGGRRVEVGEDVLSTMRGLELRGAGGTSQAAPHVAGVAALLVSRGVRGQAAVRRLLATAVDLGRLGLMRSTGRGWSTRGRRWLGWVAGSGARAGGCSGCGSGASVRSRQAAQGRRGIRVRVRSAHAGRVRVRVVRRGRLVARGSRVVRAGRRFDGRGSADAAWAAVGAAVQGAGAGSAAGRAEVARSARHGALRRTSTAAG